MISELTLEQADRAEHDRLKRIAAAWQAYEGNLPPALKETLSDPQGLDNVRLNWASLIVDASTASLWRDGTIIRADTDDATTWLDEFWHAAGRPLFCHALSTNGGVTGQVFARLEPPLVEGDFPRVTCLDSATVTMLGERDDYSDVFAYRIQWRGIDYRLGKPYVRRQIHERNETRTAWQITDQIQYGDGGATLLFAAIVRSPKWTTLSEVLHPYPWAQIHTCQNLPLPNVAWGAPDLDDDVLALNRALNANRSYIQRITRMFAHPQPVGKGFTAEQLLVGIGNTINIPADGDLYYLEMRNTLEGATEHYLRLLEALHAITRTPQVATGRTEDLGALSGIALKILYGPLVQKTDTKRELYGRLMTSLCEHALEMAGRPSTVEIEWADIVPQDLKTDLEIAAMKRDIGVSKKTVLTELGYDAAKEAESAASETEAENALGDRLLTAFERGQMGPQNR